DARAWLEREVAGGARLMGFGHRVYRVRDPRADALKAALRKLAREPGIAERLAFAEESSVSRLAFCARRNRAAFSRPMSSSTRRSSSKRWVFRRALSPRYSRWDGQRAGSPMPASSRRPGA